MQSYSDREMAIPQMFNSNAPFVIMTRGFELSFLGKENGSQASGDNKELLVQAISPDLSRVMQNGTAKHTLTEGQEVSEKKAGVSIVAQAEREDFQEFSPTNTQCLFSRCQLPKKQRSLSKEVALMIDTEDNDNFSGTAKPRHYHLQSKQRRRSRIRQSQEEGEEPPIIQGLWVQEIEWLKSESESGMTSLDEIIPPPPHYTDLDLHPHSHADQHFCGYECHSSADVCDCTSRLEDMLLSEDQNTSIDTDTSNTDDRGDSDSDCTESVCTHESESDSSYCTEDDPQLQERFKMEASMSNVIIDLMDVSGFNSSSSYCGLGGFIRTSRCAQSSLENSDSTCTPLHTLNTSLCAFNAADLSNIEIVLDGLRGLVTSMPKHFVSPFFKDLKKPALNDWNQSVPVNEGLIFHNQLQPHSSQYREGKEYYIQNHIQNGSYGDVFCVRDKRTGFECAAKRIPLSHFSREEVSTWSTLNSPRVVELFGAVREGLNIVLFMDLKPACLAQLLKEMHTLSEDLALHYLHQSLRALEHLHHRKVLHLDVKVDNVLLSADCRDTFLCDFGLSETLDENGWSTKAFRGAAFLGTETHMAPEVARGDQLCVKADVWSSCCMLLHMLNGSHPWIRYYSHPLCLQIVNEPPPLWEVPSNCNNFTAKVLRSGLQKDPNRRATAKELRRKTTKALRAVGGLSPWSIKVACEKLYHGKIEHMPYSLSPASPNTPKRPSATSSASAMCWVSPWRTTAMDEDSNDLEDSDSDQVSVVDTDWLSGVWESQPKSLRDGCITDEKEWDNGLDSEVDIYMGEEEYVQKKWLKTDSEYEGDWEEEGDEEEEWDTSVSSGYLCALRGLFPLLQKTQQTNDNSWGSEPELEYMRDGVALDTTIQTPSPEPRDDPPSCFSCSDISQMDDSDEDSTQSSDDLSSGIFSSCNSQTDGHIEWLALSNQQYFEGVDIWIENIQGECLRIRERRQVKVGHVAIGISDQIPGKAFTLETLDRKMVPFEQEIQESCLWLRCVPAPDRCQNWRWRVRDCKLELRE